MFLAFWENFEKICEVQFVSVTSENGEKSCSSEIFLYCQENPILADNGVQTPYKRVDLTHWHEFDFLDEL